MAFTPVTGGNIGHMLFDGLLPAFQALHTAITQTDGVGDKD